jgi:two-component system chemotaxis response regulator CheY
MKRLLVVDDALFMRKLICGVAAEAGWEVVGEAGDGAEAVALYERLRPDLVTMDLVMPVMGGLEALRQIRDRDPEAQVVVVTALDQKQALMDSIRDGAIDFIVKPFERQRVVNLLARAGGRGSMTHFSTRHHCGDSRASISIHRMTIGAATGCEVLIVDDSAADARIRTCSARRGSGHQGSPRRRGRWSGPAAQAGRDHARRRDAGGLGPGRTAGGSWP